MGLIKAMIGAAGGTLADQWKEFFYCDSLDADVLVTRGMKRVGKRSSNTKGHDNVISNGSGIAVADGQCMIIVDQGEIVEVCSEPGTYTYNTSSEPSIFTGNLGENIKKTFQTIGRRFTFGGDTAREQRVYYFNTKELIGNKFGTANPIPFRIVDRNINLDIDVSVRCNGIYSYKITNPLLFYKNVCGNIEGDYTRENIDSQLKNEFISALQPAFAKISALEIRPNMLPAHVDELSSAMNESLTEKWRDLRGLEIISIAINSVTLPDEDAKIIKDMQQASIMRDPTMAAASIASAQAKAMQEAAKNPNGAMMGFMGMGMANQAGNMNPQALFEMGAKNNQPSSNSSSAWVCSCGQENSGKFCSNCGKEKPSAWVCSCGTKNSGKFCTNCGKGKPEKFRCEKCGFEDYSLKEMPKFCPNCGNKLN